MESAFWAAISCLFIVMTSYLLIVTFVMFSIGWKSGWLTLIAALLLGVIACISTDNLKYSYEIDYYEESQKYEPENIYQQALKYESHREYLKAMECYIDIFDYKDSEERFYMCTKLRLMKAEEERNEASKDAVVY